MTIDEVFELLGIKKTKRMLKEARDNIKTLNDDLFELEKQKRKAASELKARELIMKRDIAMEIEPGTQNKKAFTNDSLRDAEFIMRSAADKNIADLRDELDLLVAGIFQKKISLQIEGEANKELLLDYKMAISLIPYLNTED